MTQKTRIISDGTPRGTQVLDENGKQIPGMITHVSWAIDANGTGATATVTFANVEVDIAGERASG